MLLMSSSGNTWLLLPQALASETAYSEAVYLDDIGADNATPADTHRCRSYDRFVRYAPPIENSSQL